MGKIVKGLMTQLKNSYLVMLDVQWFVILLDAMGTHLNEDLQQYTTPSLDAKIYRNWTQNYDLVLRFKSEAKIYRNWTQHNVPIVQIKSKAKIYRNWTQHNVP